VHVNIRGKIDNSRHKFPGIGLLLIRCLISEKNLTWLHASMALRVEASVFDAGGCEFESWLGNLFVIFGRSFCFFFAIVKHLAY
jgi:hypothetical protein